MFEIGEKIIYGSEGVFVVSEYTRSPIDKNDDRVFYLLKPEYGPEGNIIITPVDNPKVKMRAVMSRDEALELIKRIPKVSLLPIDQEKRRRLVYKTAMSEGDTEEYISLIKTVYERREEIIKQNKRISEADAEYEKRAKFCFYGEMAISLGIPFNEVEDFIINKLDKLEKEA